MIDKYEVYLLNKANELLLKEIEKISVDVEIKSNRHEIIKEYGTPFTDDQFWIEVKVDRYKKCKAVHSIINLVQDISRLHWLKFHYIDHKIIICFNLSFDVIDSYKAFKRKQKIKGVLEDDNDR